MNVTAAISILAIVGSLALGLYVLSRGLRVRLNQVFFATTVSITIWGVGDLVSVTSHTNWGVLLGRHIAFAGWCFLGALFLHFTLELTRDKRVLSKWWFYVLLYAPFAAALVLDWTTHSIYVKVVFGTSGYKVIGGALWWAVYGAMIGLLIVSIVLLVRYRIKATDPLERERVGYVILAALIPLIGGLVTEWLIPYKGIRPPINSLTLLLIMAAVIAYAVSKRGLMSTLLAAVGGSIVSMLSDPVLVLNSKGSIESVNLAAIEFTGYTDVDLRGAPLDTLFPGEGRSSDVIAALTKGAVSMPSECVVQDGSAIPVTIAATSLKSRSGRLAGSVVLLHDMRGAMDLVRAEERAEFQLRHSEALKDIIDVASHELRHPASVLKGYSTMLQDSWGRLDEATREETLASIDDAAERISRLSVDLMDASLMGSGAMELSRTEFDVLEVIARAVEETMLRTTDHESIVVWGKEDARLSADADKIQAVLAILLDNAVKFSPGNEIETWFEQSDGETVFCVADRGEGIPAEHREMIFERFYQVAGATHHSLPGMGLGLYIARMIVQAHGGWINVEPRDEGGSVFSFGIPDSS
ncbi:MAG: ATP-binding protein [Candidatus Geothermincolia bacterium]